MKLIIEGNNPNNKLVLEMDISDEDTVLVKQRDGIVQSVSVLTHYITEIYDGRKKCAQ